jgi:hypothetical protein
MDMHHVITSSEQRCPCLIVFHPDNLFALCPPFSAHVFRNLEAFFACDPDEDKAIVNKFIEIYCIYPFLVF